FQAEDGIRDFHVTGVQTCALPIFLDGRILPYLGATPLEQITLTEIKAWRATLDPATQATNAAAYRLLRSLLQAAEEEELIDRARSEERRVGKESRRRWTPHR